MTINNPALADFKSIHNKAFIGFDELFRAINELEKPKSGFPPYDIIKISDEDFKIKMAVAGFSKDQISVVLDSGKLTVSGSIDSEKKEQEYIYKGIAERGFSRTFRLAETVQVDRVYLEDGILTVNLKNVIPESQKPKKFSIE